MSQLNNQLSDIFYLRGFAVFLHLKSKTKHLFTIKYLAD